MLTLEELDKKMSSYGVRQESYHLRELRLIWVCKLEGTKQKKEIETKMENEFPQSHWNMEQSCKQDVPHFLLASRVSWHCLGHRLDSIITLPHHLLCPLFWITWSENDFLKFTIQSAVPFWGLSLMDPVRFSSPFAPQGITTALSAVEKFV